MNVHFFTSIESVEDLLSLKKFDTFTSNLTLFINKKIKKNFESIYYMFKNNIMIKFIDNDNDNLSDKLSLMKIFKKILKMKYFCWLDINIIKKCENIYNFINNVKIIKSNKLLIVTGYLFEDYGNFNIKKNSSFIIKSRLINIYQSIANNINIENNLIFFNYINNDKKSYEFYINDNFPFDSLINDEFMNYSKIFKQMCYLKNINKFIKTQNITDIYKFIIKYNYFDYLSMKNDYIILFLILLEHHRIVSKNFEEYKFILEILDKLYIKKQYKTKLLYEIVLYCFETNDKNIGAQQVLKYINSLNKNEHDYGCLSNIDTFIENISERNFIKTELKFPNIENFFISNITMISNNEINIKYINYTFKDNKYKICDENYRFITKNFYAKINKNFEIIEVNEMSINTDMKFYESPSYGMEDLIYYNNKFIAKQIEYSSSRKEEICIGNYDINKLEFNNINIIYNPSHIHFTKIWFPITIKNEQKYIYSLYPLKICSIFDNKLLINIEKEMPKFFEYCNIEFGPIKYKEKLLFLLYFKDNIKKKYYHMFVLFDSNFNISNIYKPFKFSNEKFDYCTYINIKNNEELNLIYTTNYTNPTLLTINLDEFDEIYLY